MKKTTMIVDLDGTLACDHHRRHHIGRGDWDSYWLGCHEDAPNAALIALLQLARHDYRIVIMTGRMNHTGVATQKWLRTHEVPYDNILMRPNHMPYDCENPSDFVPDTELKQLMLDMEGLTPDNLLAP